MFSINQKVKIKPDAWKKVLSKHNYSTIYENIGAQTIIRKLPNRGGKSNAYYLLTFPFVWWEEEDLEPAEEVIYEKVDTIKIKNKNVRVGDILRCSCRYEVNILYPTWDNETGKHITTHYNNSFSYKLIKGCLCPIHR